ncbi:lipid A-modifier LpxR family protein [Stenotrophomonas indicatrix]|uniref:lipid A-modifier LpxR family protein n=1 Tax=Stenotrophomonas indicatrix TaxID=2045451 RepID=UPI003D0F7A4D
MGCPGCSAHLFLGTTGTWVARELSLDGSSFQRSNRVSKRPWVAELGCGVVVNERRWRITLAQNRGTREFESQRDTPDYGSVTVGYAFD